MNNTNVGTGLAPVRNFVHIELTDFDKIIDKHQRDFSNRYNILKRNWFAKFRRFPAL